jgi:hypothetical protein
MASFLDRERSIAGPGFNRWLIPPAALAIHLCIGQAYATSVYKNGLVKNFDTGNTQIGIVFSIAIVMLGLSAAVAGTWVERVGPASPCSPPPASGRSASWSVPSASPRSSCGCSTSATASSAASGLGIGYISPVSTLIKWFPDRRAWPPVSRSWASVVAR